MTEYQPSTMRPKVTVDPDDDHDGWWIAWCHTCPTHVYRNCSKSDVMEKARHHRDAHRLGRVPVVEAEQLVEFAIDIAEPGVDKALRSRSTVTPDEYDPNDEHMEDA